MKRTACFAVILFLASALSGCGENKGTIHGTVTFDGQPVANGSITFVESQGALVREGAVIKDGAFQARVPPGSYKIELNAQKVVGKRRQKGFSGEEEEVVLTEELFPEWYNTQTELREEIKSGTNTVKLELKSKR